MRHLEIGLLACHISCMADNASHSQSGWVVRVTAPEQMGGGAPEPEIWDVAMSDPDEAVKEVHKYIRASGERIEAVQELSAARVRSFGLTHGQAKQRL